jgi:hypothetical protein
MKTSLTFVLLLLCGVTAIAGEIDRKTYSLSLPKGWTEDTKDDMYEPDSFVFFENAESCLFTVIIGTKSAGATAATMLNGQKESWKKRVTDAKWTDITEWSHYKGNGAEVEGKIQGIIRVRARLFAFETERYVCVITEYATVGDWKKFESDFNHIRQSFKLK